MQHTPNLATAERANANRMVGLRVSPEEFAALSRYASADRRSIAGFVRLLVQKTLDDLGRAEANGQPAVNAIAALRRDGR